METNHTTTPASHQMLSRSIMLKNLQENAVMREKELGVADKEVDANFFMSLVSHKTKASKEKSGES